MSDGPDLTGLSDDDLRAVAQGKMSALSEAGLRQLAGKAAAPPPEQPGVLERAGTQIGHGLLDTAGSVAHGIGSSLDVGRNLYRSVTGGEPVQRNSDESLATQFARPFQHEADAPEAPDVKEQVRQSLPKLGDQPGVQSALAAIPEGVKNTVAPMADAAMTGLGLAGAAEPIMAARAAGAARSAAAVPAVATRLNQAGYKMLPSDLERLNPQAATEGQIPGTTAERLNPPDTRSMQLKNAANTGKLAAEGVGLPNPGHITDADYDAARGIRADGSVDVRSPLGTYQRAAAAVPKGAPASPDLLADFKKVADSTEASDPNMQDQISRIAERYGQKYQAGGLDGQQMLNDISTLRARARTDFNSAVLDNQDRAMAYRGMADALEKEMARNFPPDSQLAHDFQDARTKLAQINDLQTATKAGAVDPAVMARLRAKGAAMTGNNATIADAGESLPGTVVHPSQIARPEAGSVAGLIPKAKNLLNPLAGNPVAKAGRAAAAGTNVAPEAASGLELEAPPSGEGPPEQRGLPIPARTPKDEAPPAFQLQQPEGGDTGAPAQRDLGPLSPAEWDRAALARVRAMTPPERAAAEGPAAVPHAKLTTPRRGRLGEAFMKGEQE